MTTRSLSLYLIILLLPAMISTYTIEDGTLVQLPKGFIRGHILQSENGNDYYAFQEIPYAAPPIGENRFQLPKEPEPWFDILDTTKNTKICYQYVNKYANLEMSEDCLFINVYTPQKPGSADLLPVLLWIHGGGLQNESSTFEYYGPKYIMDHGVVVVTFNYRLGSFGFLGTEDGVIPYNIGLKDQAYAINWVNENIHVFGGNPDQITLAGESAGSISVGYHLVGPWADNKVLFHAVIMQSGSPVSGLLENTMEDSTLRALKLGKDVDPSFSSDDTRELLRVLQSANPEDILRESPPTDVIIENNGPFSYPALQAFVDGNYKQVPVLLGFNSEEWLEDTITADKMFLEALDADPSVLIRPMISILPENKGIVAKFLKQLYTNNKGFAKDRGGYTRFMTDDYFTNNMCKQVELASKRNPYYFYQFSYKGLLGGQMNLLENAPADVQTVTHAEDLRYMWDDGTNSDLSEFPESDGLMLHRFVKLWTNFVKFFNPTVGQDPLLDDIQWLPSRPNNLRYLNLDTSLEMRKNPRQYIQVKKIKDKYTAPPLIAY